VDFLLAEADLAGAQVADVGSGPGNLARLLLPHAARVYGVEPNQEMREAGEALLAAHPNFTSLPASAESTTLPDASVDLITAGQAFHWFDPEPTKAEFRRILRPGGAIALVWNERNVTDDPFSVAYEAHLRRASPEYLDTSHSDRAPLSVIEAFLAPAPVGIETFAHEQALDWAGLRGRVESSSYYPEPGDAGYDTAIADLRKLFDAHAEGGFVSFRYRTRVYFARW